MCCAHHGFDQMPHQIGKLYNSDTGQCDAIIWLSESQVVPGFHEVFEEMPVELG
jgi:hypothetical protein